MNHLVPSRDIRQESQATLVTQCPGAFIIRKSQTKPDSYEAWRSDLTTDKQPTTSSTSSSRLAQSQQLLDPQKGQPQSFSSTVTTMWTLTTWKIWWNTSLNFNTGRFAHSSVRADATICGPYRESSADACVYVSSPVFILEKRCIRSFPLDSLKRQCQDTP